LQRWILTSVGNLSDCDTNRIVIGEVNLLLLPGAMRHVTDPKAMTKVWESDPQSVCIFMQSRRENDKRNRRLLQRSSECLLGFRSLKAATIMGTSRQGLTKLTASMTLIQLRNAYAQPERNLSYRRWRFFSERTKKPLPVSFSVVFSLAFTFRLGCCAQSREPGFSPGRAAVAHYLEEL